MRAKTLSDLLRKGDRVAVSNITGREASVVAEVTQRYAGNIVGGWSLGKGGARIPVGQSAPIPVFSDYAQMLESLPPQRHPNKITIYSPPEAVYGEVKNILGAPGSVVETIFIITEHVSTEVSSKIRNLCQAQNVDVIGCNSLGIINVADHVRIGAVGGDHPEEAFIPGGATILSNSGNMVNTMASYLHSAGIGIRYGLSTGKDRLILTPLRDLLELALNEGQMKVIVLYVEPGGLYEQIAVGWMAEVNFPIPLLVYVCGSLTGEKQLSLGHAGAVVEGAGTSAPEKMALFDNYFGVPPFTPGMSFPQGRAPRRGLRIGALHDLPEAARVLYDTLNMERDSRQYHRLQLNPWLKNMGALGTTLPPRLVLSEGHIPSPYREQIEQFPKMQFGRPITRRDMRHASHASSNDGATPRVYGHSLIELMEHQSFAHTLILGWTGAPPSRPFEPQLVEQALIAAFTNGPGTISAQAAKLSASAGNEPHTAMIATLATTGLVHGGNGKEAVSFMIGAFSNTPMTDPYDGRHRELVVKTAHEMAAGILKRKLAVAEQDLPLERVPCLGHPVYHKEEVNYDPRERAIAAFLDRSNIYHAFFHFYHELAAAMRELRITPNVLAVNADAAIACVWLGICWPLLCAKKMTKEAAERIPMIAFALGRAAGGASEYLDHADYGLPMDMRQPVTECHVLTPPKNQAQG